MLKKVPLLFVLLTSISLASSLYGTIYTWSDLEPLQNAIVYVNSTPAQQLVSKEGNYSFRLEPGYYKIMAKYYENNSLALEAEEEIVIQADGDYVLDLIMFPSIDLGESFFNETGPQLDESIFDEQDDLITIILFSIALTFVILLVAAKLGLRPKEEARTPPEVKPKRLPRESKQVLDIIKSEQRLTQKELRKKLPWSEAKVSLVIADLEERGLIKKIKKGRGNIIKIG